MQNKIGDIVLIGPFKNRDGKLVGPHPFVVLDNQMGIIQGYDFDLIATMLSSIKSDEQIKKIKKYSSNIIISKKHGTKENSFTAINEVYYFMQDKHVLKKLGTLDNKIIEKIYDELAKLYEKNKIAYITENIK